MTYMAYFHKYIQNFIQKWVQRKSKNQHRQAIKLKNSKDDSYLSTQHPIICCKEHFIKITYSGHKTYIKLSCLHKLGRHFFFRPLFIEYWHKHALNSFMTLHKLICWRENLFICILFNYYPLTARRPQAQNCRKIFYDSIFFVKVKNEILMMSFVFSTFVLIY